MAISVSVPKDLSKIKTKVAFNLTKRQIICFGAGAVLAVPVFFLSKKVLGMETSLIICMASCVPFFVLGLYEKNGMPAEKLIFHMVRHNYIRPLIRERSMDTKFDEEEKKKKVREEIKELERKGKEKKR
ncbi:MAG: PrgI family protein [Lachnospiraceae bacterium]|nr:PrgI family protein [Lachnospiraceae bacterium]